MSILEWAKDHRFLDAETFALFVDALYEGVEPGDDEKAEALHVGIVNYGKLAYFRNEKEGTRYPKLGRKVR